MDRIYNVLFLCTGNSARSIMAEAVLNQIGSERFRAYSAGSHPANQVNPHTAALLRKHKHPVDNLRSKGWEEFSKPDAPEMDLIITVCDRAAGEVCPVWPGRPITAHWGFEDPAAFVGNEEATRAFFESTYRQITTRVRLLVNLPLRTLDRVAAQQKIRDIGAAPVSIST